MIGIIVVIILGTIILATRNSKQITGVEGAVGSVLTPIENTATSFTYKVGNWFRTVFGISDIQKDNEQMRQQILSMEGDLALLKELQLENERLKEIAGFIEDRPDFEVVTARISAKSPGYWFDTFLINAGYNQGIKADMVVVTPQGYLIGRIYKVSGDWAQVTSIIDGDSSVASIVERTRDNTVVKGNLQVGLQDSLCTMTYVPLDNDLIPGDRVLTSGLGGVYPRGLPIGEIIEITKQENSSEKIATIKPAADFMKLEEVLVIKNVFEQVSP